MSRLSESCLGVGRIEKALELNRQSSEIQMRVIGPERPTTLATAGPFFVISRCWSTGRAADTRECFGNGSFTDK
jgi:hypothetical protein